MLNKKQQKKLNKLKVSFVELHGERKWNGLLKYIEIPWMTTIKISRVLILSTKAIDYWTKKIRKINKN